MEKNAFCHNIYVGKIYLWLKRALVKNLLMLKSCSWKKLAHCQNRYLGKTYLWLNELMV